MSDHAGGSCFPFTRHRDEIERAIRELMLRADIDPDDDKSQWKPEASDHEARDLIIEWQHAINEIRQKWGLHIVPVEPFISHYERAALEEGDDELAQVLARQRRNAYAQEIRQWLAHLDGIERGTKRR